MGARRLHSETEETGLLSAAEATTRPEEKTSLFRSATTEPLINVDQGETGCVLILFAHVGVDVLLHNTGSQRWL